jgi:hypothetical protein
MGTHPLAGGELSELRTVETASGVAKDLFGRGSHAETGLLDAAGDATIVAVCPFAVDEEAELVLEAEVRVWGHLEHLTEAFRQRVQFQVDEFLDGFVDGHDDSLSK